MKDEHEHHGPGQIFENDDLDDVVTAADDTGMLAGQRLITEGAIVEAEHEGDEKPGAGDV